MNNICRKRIAVFLSAVLLLTALSLSVCAAEVEIAVGDVSFDPYVATDGTVQAENGTVTVEFSKLSLAGQLTLLLTTAEITEVSESAAEKIVYVLQTDPPANKILSFPITKAQIAEALGTENIIGARLYLKVNGTDGGDAQLVTVKYNDSDTSDADVNKDGSVTIVDALLALRAFLNDSTPMLPDINGDGKVSLTDIVRILRLCVNG